MAEASTIANTLISYHRRVILRTSDDFRPPPDVNSRRVSPATMRKLRDGLDLVEDGFGLWRRTDLGRDVARICLLHNRAGDPMKPCRGLNRVHLPQCGLDWCTQKAAYTHALGWVRCRDHTFADSGMRPLATPYCDESILWWQDELSGEHSDEDIFGPRAPIPRWDPGPLRRILRCVRRREDDVVYELLECGHRLDTRQRFPSKDKVVRRRCFDCRDAQETDQGASI